MWRDKIEPIGQAMEEVSPTDHFETVGRNGKLGDYDRALSV